MIDIITDSTSDLPEELLSKRNIHIIPLYVILDSKTYKDRIEISNDEIFDFVKKTGNLPKTSAISIKDFIQHFSHHKPQLFLGIGGKFSATYNNAIAAANEIKNDNIHIIDSMTLSSGIGQLVLLAADLRDAGVETHQIVSEIEKARQKVRVSFMIETLDYLYKGGRCSAIQNIFGSLLSIRPVIEVRQDGTLGVKAKMRASRQKVIQYMLEQFKADLPILNPRRIFITHTGCEQDAYVIRSQILSLCQPEELILSTAGSVIASHCGPDTIGLIYMVK